jgi:hypothetical protein
MRGCYRSAELVVARQGLRNNVQSEAGIVPLELVGASNDIFKITEPYDTGVRRCCFPGYLRFNFRKVRETAK